MLDTRLEELTLTEEQFCRISDLVYNYCGINLHDGKKELVRSRLAKRLRTLKIRSFEDYLAYALKDPSGGEFTHLIDALSTNLTSFFREPQHFAYLREHFYPALLTRKRAAKQWRIRAWSAGCSSGEEPYSIAISLLEAFQGQGRWDAKILATDLSTQVLTRAREGVYEAARVAPLTGTPKQRYLIRRDQGASFEVAPAVLDCQPRDDGGIHVTAAGRVAGQQALADERAELAPHPRAHRHGEATLGAAQHEAGQLPADGLA